MTPAPLQTWIPGTPPEDTSAALFGGALIAFRGLEPVERLAVRVRTILEAVFETHDPMCAEAAMEPAAFHDACRRARRLIDRDTDARLRWRAGLGAMGYDPDLVHLDRIRLRVVPSRRQFHGRVFRPLPAHRDTWGSGIMAQINWWLPLYPLAPARTMLVWPDAFGRPVPNDSATWDYERLMQGAQKDYSLLPAARTVPDEPGLPVVMEPGALLAFSAAHLHASAADASGLTRFSVDTRTVWTGDVLAGRGAPNVDCAARRPRWEWLSRPAAEPAPRQGDGNRHYEGVYP